MFKGSPAGGAYASAPDLYQFALALTNHRLLSKTNTDKLLSTTIQKPNTNSDTFHVGKNTVFGYDYYGTFTQFGFAGNWNQYGFAIWKDPLILGHTGGIDGVDNYFGIYTKQGYIVIVLSNVSNHATINVLSKINELLGFKFDTFNL